MSTEQATSGPGPSVKPSWLDGYRFGLRMTERGEVVSVGDGIARVRGLPSAAMSELLRFAGGSRALVFALDEETLGAIMLEGSDEVVAGQQVYLTGRTLGIGVGEELLGRVLDPLGSALDGMPDPQASERRHLEAASPPIVAREFVETPLYTGNKIIDGLVPIGKGQRQLLIGDNGLGKTSVALDVVLNQKDKGVLCVYVLIGQKRSTVAGIIETLRQHDAMGYTVVVVAEATATPGLKYLAPFAGCSIAEYWMLRGRDTLIVYDDLTMHAQAYRELSLLLKRPPGREAYPGDVFYLHSRLLERSTHLKATHGGGSMTALPIGETQEGEIASYIPTNLISITDGQVYFDSAQFSSGALPAIDVRRSVSRIGGKAQDPLVRKEAARMKLDYLQFLELEVFTRFGARLEASAEKRIARGRVLRELLKQDRLAPLPIEAQVAWMIAFNDGRFDGSDAAEIRERFAILAERSRDSGLGLSDDRDTWSREVAAWLGQAGETGETGETGESPP